GQDHVGTKFDKIRGCGPNEVHVVAGPTLVELGVNAGGPTTFSQLLAKGAHARLHFGVRWRKRHQNPDPAHPLALLRARRERPRRRAGEEGNELAALHSITSSAVASSLSGTVRPSILAVGTLMTSSNLLDCTTGNSAGFAPLRMRPA